MLDDLIHEIEREFGLARVASSRIALRYLQLSYEEGFSRGLQDVRLLYPRLQTSFARPDPRRVQHLSRYSFEAIRDIEVLGSDRVRRVFQDAVDNAHWDTRDVTAALRREFYDVAESRLPVIARTETNRSGNAAKMDRYASLGITQKEALTAEDSRVRTFDTSGADHTALNGQIRNLGERFSVPRIRGAASAHSNFDQHPPFDPNCRCTVLPHIPNPEALLAARDAGNLLRQWHETVDAYATSWHMDMRRVWREAFERSDYHIRVRGPEALAEARES